MPRISLALSEIIKRRLFRAREHLECCDEVTLEPHIENLSIATYEIARAFGLPAVRSSAPDTQAAAHIADAHRNLTTVIDIDLTTIDNVEDPELVVQASQELMAALQIIPLPSLPSIW